MYGVFTLILCVEIDISLDNPGFQLDVSDQVEIHQAMSHVHLRDHHPLERLLVPVCGVMAG